MAENQGLSPSQSTPSQAPQSTETQPTRSLSQQPLPAALDTHLSAAPVSASDTHLSAAPAADSSTEASSKKTKRTASSKSKSKTAPDTNTQDSNTQDSNTQDSNSQQPSPPQSKPPALVVGIDYGASVIKVIYQKVGPDVVHFMSIEPYVTPTSFALIKDCLTSDVDSIAEWHLV